MGIVGDALRRPIQEAVKEGVREAIREDEGIRVRRESRESWGRPGQEGPDDDGGRGGKFAMLVLLGVGVAAFMLWRRRQGGPGGVTQSIREQSKTGRAGPGGSSGSAGVESTRNDVEAGGAVGSTDEGVGAEDAAPGAGSE